MFPAAASSASRSTGPRRSSWRIQHRGGGAEKRTAGLLMLAYAVALLIVFWIDYLPAKARADSAKIAELASRDGPIGDRSFDSISALYRGLGLDRQPLLAGLLGVSLCVVTLFVVVRQSELAAARLSDSVLLAITVGLAGVFVGQYSKELVTVLFVLVVGFVAGRSRLSPLLIGVAFVVIGLVFRRYWLLTGGVFVALHLVSARPRSFRSSVVATIGVALTSWLAFDVASRTVRGVGVLSYRQQVIDVLGQGSTNTTVVPLLPGASVGVSVAENALSFVRLQFPVELVRLGPSYAVFAVTVAVLWWRFYSGARRCIDASARAGVRDARSQQLRSVLIAVAIVQAAFEPDFGSYIRHLFPFLPLFAVLAIRSRGVVSGSGQRVVVAR